MTKQEGLWIENLRLHFSSHQLEYLNKYFTDLEINQNSNFKSDTVSDRIEGEVDRLIQYLCDVVGNIDSRFSSEFLIRLNSYKVTSKYSPSYIYLVRLDKLSFENSTVHNEIDDIHIEFDDDEKFNGYSKVKLTGEIRKQWQEFANKDGHLRRDAVQKKFIKLLEEAASPNISFDRKVIKKVTSYNSPGKVVDAEILHYILETPAAEQIFYGYADEGKKFDSTEVRKFRIEIIESNCLIKMKIEFLPPHVITTRSVEVILFLGIGLLKWPSSSDYPQRVPFTNCDILLHYQIATLGCFLITANASILMENKMRSKMWQFYFPAADCVLLHHYSEKSCVIRTLNIMYGIIQDLRRSTTGGHTIGMFLLRTLLWFEVETINDTKLWTWVHLSRHIISILNKLIVSLRSQKCRSYFFNNYNALTNSFRNSCSRHSAKDYKKDADFVEAFLHRIHALSSKRNMVELEGTRIEPFASESLPSNYELMCKYESMVMNKWTDTLDTLMNCRKQRNKQINFLSQQLEYISFMFCRALVSKMDVRRRNPRLMHSYDDEESSSYSTYCSDKTTFCVDDIVFIICSIFDQAKRLYAMKYDGFGSRSFLYGGTVTLDKIDEARYVKATRVVIERIRESKTRVDFRCSSNTVELIFSILFESWTRCEILRKILKPYVKKLLICSRENCWYLQEWKNRIFNEELLSLRLFCQLVSKNQIKFKSALLEAWQKGWKWAEEMIKLCIGSRNGQDLLFNSATGKISRRYLIFSENEIRTFQKYSQLACCSIDLIELAGDLDIGKEFSAGLSEEKTATYSILRDLSPITRIVNRNRRHGIHVSLGDIPIALVFLGKFSALLEITQTFPEQKRRRALQSIRRLIKHRHRLDRKQANAKDYQQAKSTYRTLQLQILTVTTYQ